MTEYLYEVDRIKGNSHKKCIFVIRKVKVVKESDKTYKLENNSFVKKSDMQTMEHKYFLEFDKCREYKNRIVERQIKKLEKQMEWLKFDLELLKDSLDKEECEE